MRIDRLTPCTVFDLRTPIWNNGKRVVGLNKARITRHNEINLSYVRKSDGQRSFPDPYYFNGEKLEHMEFAEQTVKGGVKLVLIPFSELEPLERILVSHPPTPPKYKEMSKQELKKDYPLVNKVFFEKEDKQGKLL